MAWTTYHSNPGLIVRRVHLLDFVTIELMNENASAFSPVHRGWGLRWGWEGNRELKADSRMTKL